MHIPLLTVWILLTGPIGINAVKVLGYVGNACMGEVVFAREAQEGVCYGLAAYTKQINSFVVSDIGDDQRVDFYYKDGSNGCDAVEVGHASTEECYVDAGNVGAFGVLSASAS